MENSKIQWTSHTFNSWAGCVEIGSQCDNCYARELNARFHPDEPNWGVHERRRFLSESYWKQPIKWNADAEKAGVRRRVFAHSMSDWAEILHEGHPDSKDMRIARYRLFMMIEATPHLDWLLLTKRISNAAKLVPQWWLNGHWPKNVLIGISVGNQEEADRDIPKLLEIPAPVRFLSIEPMLSEIDLDLSYPCEACEGYGGGTNYSAISTDDGAWECNRCEGTGKIPFGNIHWVICGGESGKNARPSDPDWFRSLRDRCAVAGVPFFFKQAGNILAKEWGCKNSHGSVVSEWPEEFQVQQFPAIFEEEILCA